MAKIVTNRVGDLILLELTGRTLDGVDHHTAVPLTEDQADALIVMIRHALESPDTLDAVLDRILTA